MDQLFKEAEIQVEKEVKYRTSCSPRIEVMEEENSSEGQQPASMSVVIPKPESKEQMVIEDRDQQKIDHDTSSNIQVDRVRSATFKVPICVNGRMTKAVLDNGAEVTVLESHLYFGLSEDKRPKFLKKASRNLVVAEAGKKMHTHGVATMDVQIGGKIFPWEMYVAPIGDDILLGCDIVDEVDITINSKRVSR